MKTVPSIKLNHQPQLLVHPNNQQALDAYLASSNHSLLISGPNGSGKLSFVLKNISELTSQANPVNLLLLDKGSDTLISIEKIKQIGEFTKLKSEYDRFVVIDGVEAMSSEANGALLKTLEEPTPHVKFILLTSSQAKVLPTILSRTSTHTWTQPTREQFFEYFSGYTSQQKDSAYAVSRGNFTLYRDFLTTGSSLTDYLADSKTFVSGTSLVKVKIVQKYIKDNSAALAFLETLLLVQSALLKSSRLDDKLVKQAEVTLEAYEAIKGNAKVNLQLARLL
jgi:DNA polymerase III, delta subunit